MIVCIERETFVRYRGLRADIRYSSSAFCLQQTKSNESIEIRAKKSISSIFVSNTNFQTLLITKMNEYLAVNDSRMEQIDLTAIDLMKISKTEQKCWENDRQMVHKWTEGMWQMFYKKLPKCTIDMNIQSNPDLRAIFIIPLLCS